MIGCGSDRRDDHLDLIRECGERVPTFAEFIDIGNRRTQAASGDKCEAHLLYIWESRSCVWCELVLEFDGDLKEFDGRLTDLGLLIRTDEPAAGTGVNA